MGLEQVRRCSIRHLKKIVEITGICKETEVKHVIQIKTESYHDWQSGIPLSYAAPSLTRKEITFLNTGVWRD